MAFDLSSITSEMKIRAPRIILLGVEKIGKSTFASQSDCPILIPIKGEEGIDELKCNKLPKKCANIGEVFGWFNSLCEGAHEHGTAVVDSVSALEPLIWDKVCEDNNGVDSIEKVGGGFQVGYTEALKTWRTLTEWLDSLRNHRNMASILIGHVKVKRFDSPDAGSWDRWEWDIHYRAANLLYRWADVILFANSRVAVQKEDVGFGKSVKRGVSLGDKRYVYTQKSPAYPAGGRGVYGRLPAEIDLSWPAFMAAVSAQVAVEQAAQPSLHPVREIPL